MSDPFQDYLSRRLTEEMTPLVQQATVLFACPNPQAALQIDQIVEQIHRAHPLFSWTGIYYRVGDNLRLCSFRGPYTPHAVIPVSQGICGAAVRENRTLNIPDVSADPRYLSCDFRAKSEIVVPIRNAQGEAIAEIDIDSHHPAAFTAKEEQELERVARELAPLVLQLGIPSPL